MAVNRSKKLKLEVCAGHGLLLCDHIGTYFTKTSKPCNVRAIFNRVSKVIHDCIGFTSLCSVIGSENSRHLLNQSDAKTKTNHNLVTQVFPRLRPATCVYFEFSLAPSETGIFLLAVVITLVLDLRHSIEKRSMGDGE